MLKPEQKVWRSVSKSMTLARVKWFDRIESRVSKNGMPDVIVIHNHLLFLELKAGYVSKNGRVKIVNWTAQQRKWAVRSIEALTPCWLVVGIMNDRDQVDEVRWLHPRHFCDQPVGSTYFDPNDHDSLRLTLESCVFKK